MDEKLKHINVSLQSVPQNICCPVETVATCYHPGKKKRVAFGYHREMYMYDVGDIHLLDDEETDEEGDRDDIHNEPTDIMKVEGVEDWGDKLPAESSYIDCTNRVQMASFIPQRSEYQTSRRGSLVYSCPWCGQMPSAGRRDKVIQHINGRSTDELDPRNGCGQRRLEQSEWLQANPGKNLPTKLIKEPIQMRDLDKHGYLVC